MPLLPRCRRRHRSLRPWGPALGLAALLPGAAGLTAQDPQTRPATPPLPIAAVREDSDGDYVPDRLGDTVTVAGRASTASSVLDRYQLRVFVQDGSGGILLFSPRAGGRIQSGDSVVATGVIGQYRGLTQIGVMDYRVVPGPPRVPEAVELPTHRDSLEALEGSLIRVTAYVKGFGVNQGGRFLLLGPPEAPEALLAVFVARNHGVAPDLESISVGDRVRVTGPLGQYDADPPYDSYYQLYPRSPADLKAAGLTRVLLRRFLDGAVVLLVLAATGVLLLRGMVGRRTRELAESRRSGKESRERLSVLLDHAPVALWTVDRELRFTWAEGRGLMELGLEPGDLVGLTVAEVFDTPLEPYRRALDGAPGHFDMDWRARTWEVRLHPLREGGEITGVVGAALDATSHREIERRLEEQRAHFQTLFEEAPEAVVLVDEDDRVLQVNPEFEAMFGYGAGEAEGRLVNDLISVPGREEEAMELTERVARGERLQVEAVRRRKDGTPVEVSILATPMEVGGRRRVYGIYRDITEQKALEAQLLHSQRLEAVGQLAGGIAHDFNNILTAILGHTRVLLDELGHDGRWREDLEQIEAAGERASRLTQKLLTFSRRDMASPRVVDLNTAVRDTRELLGRLVEERVQLRYELADDLPAVKADPGQLEQILMNLVINARDAMPVGGLVTVSTRRAPRETASQNGAQGDEERWVVLEVRDEGRGMAPDEEARMFEPFFTTKGPGEGTGLGLSTVYGIVEQAGGFIEVETAPGAGTGVRICLPTAPPDERHLAPGVPGALDDDDQAPGRGELVLLVDDDRPVREVTRRILARAGYDVVTAASGREALEFCENSGVGPHAVVTDIVMPEMTGYELVEELRIRYPTIRVLMMTGYTEPAPGQQNVDGEILRKPFDAMTLVRRLRERLVAP